MVALDARGVFRQPRALDHIREVCPARGTGMVKRARFFFKKRMNSSPIILRSGQNASQFRKRSRASTRTTRRSNDRRRGHCLVSFALPKQPIPGT
jgi:hypothetical protein